MKLSEDIRLEHVFTLREYRTLGSGHTLSYGGAIYTFAESLPQRFDAKNGGRSS